MAPAEELSYFLIETAKLCGVDTESRLADTLARIQDHKITHLGELMPWYHPSAQ